MIDQPVMRTKTTPQLATSPEDVLQMLRQQIIAAANGISVTAAGALRVPEVLACINVLAQSISMLPLHIMERSGDVRRKLPDHPVSMVLGERPNTYQSPLEFFRMMTFNAAWQGNAYAHIGRMPVTGQILRITPLPNHTVTPVLNDDFTIEYEYKKDSQSAKVVYKQNVIFHLRGPICPNGWMSESPVLIAKEAIATMIALDRYGSKYFAGGAKANGAFRLPTMDSLNDEQYDRLKKSLNDAAEGDTIPLLEQGLDWINMDYSARESLLSDIGDAQVNKICRVWRIQPHLIQSLKNATFSNIEHQSREFVDHTLMPWIRLWESAIKTQLMATDGRDVYPKISAQALLRGDNKTRAEFYASAVQGPWMSANEARAFEDMDAVEGADELLKPLNMTTVSEVPDDPV